MTLIQHADDLAELPDKLVRRYEVPFADGAGTTWRFVEEFDTTEPVIAGLPENYIEQIVSAYVATGGGLPGADRPRSLPYRGAPVDAGICHRLAGNARQLRIARFADLDNR